MPMTSKPLVFKIHRMNKINSLTGFSLLFRQRTLVAAGHVTTRDNELLIRVGPMYYLNMS